MATIDIRAKEEDSVIDTIHFGAELDGYNDRNDTANIIKIDEYRHESLIFIEGGEQGDYIAVRKRDIGNLIKALEYAVELGWDK